MCFVTLQTGSTEKTARVRGPLNERLPSTPCGRQSSGGWETGWGVSAPGQPQGFCCHPSRMSCSLLSRVSLVTGEVGLLPPTGSVAESALPWAQSCSPI